MQDVVVPARDGSKRPPRHHSEVTKAIQEFEESGCARCSSRDGSLGIEIVSTYLKASSSGLLLSLRPSVTTEDRHSAGGLFARIPGGICSTKYTSGLAVAGASPRLARKAVGTGRPAMVSGAAIVPDPPALPATCGACGSTAGARNAACRGGRCGPGGACGCGPPPRGGRGRPRGRVEHQGPFARLSAIVQRAGRRRPRRARGARRQVARLDRGTLKALRSTRSLHGKELLDAMLQQIKPHRTVRHLPRVIIERGLGS